MANLHEECGVFGMYVPQEAPLSTYVYAGLTALQHRGQESCGMVVNRAGLFSVHKGIGLVNDVFPPEVLDQLGGGSIAIGHARYGTTGGNEMCNVQPIVVNHLKGHTALAHNGNLTNALELRTELERQGSIFHTTADTEVISYLITRERLTAPSLADAACRVMDRIQGAYSLVMMSPTKLVALRDERGFRPLCYGTLPGGGYVVASESCALDAVGATYVREVEPGEILVFSKEGIRSIRDHCGKKPRSLCVFEAVYFARPDSILDGVTVHEARVRAGQILAQECPADADVVVGVPDSGLDAALGFARESGIPYEIGFVKNKYIARTFIVPGQDNREHKVSLKLNPVVSSVAGKRVVLVDDSIVRGTTSKRIVKMLRDAGATEIHLRSSAPAFLNPCYYGTDVDSRENLIAVDRTNEEIAALIGADSVGYLSVDAVQRLMGDDPGKGYCTACFGGEYPTDPPSDTRKYRFSNAITV
ncbi:MAG: amidophosphoribosyltransferase [Coriobacteriia bacterium]|nr:amidophosphoribosyltransferase [Coriobacteriia bacterium]